MSGIVYLAAALAEIAGAGLALVSMQSLLFGVSGAALFEGPDARAAFEEAVRYETPVQTFFRTTTREVEVGGITLPEGAKVLMFLASANRDPRRWEAPESYDIGRRASGHVGFGSGVHMCVGQLLARLEGEVVLDALARHCSAINLAGEPQRSYNNTLRGLAALPVQLVGG